MLYLQTGKPDGDTGSQMQIVRKAVLDDGKRYKKYQCISGKKKWKRNFVYFKKADDRLGKTLCKIENTEQLFSRET